MRIFSVVQTLPIDIATDPVLFGNGEIDRMLRKMSEETAEANGVQLPERPTRRSVAYVVWVDDPPGDDGEPTGSWVCVPAAEAEFVVYHIRYEIED